ncbi:hypothetical protein DFQ04_1657 [Algoriphagus boseongensis]|uniref:Uncharacterized protein n=1 Tax=Algoriphagus boseongensis TaxID=1442587 RepID=A0A4R6T4V2_9BACT|nr:hypothetical protein [Algoriphagus boseongensis]TDQ17009.1 hypothetical protein DFQ04_1657 [Algoriphagus boseongensis]
MKKQKTPWWGNFKDFFLLFLAVFCGFLAENYRESLSNKTIEKEFMISLVEDLKSDTASLKSYMVFKRTKGHLMDSLATMLVSKQRNEYGNQLYFLARQVFNESPFVYSDGTIQQLKNAGNLRLIKKRVVVDELLKYEKKVKVLEDWDENDNRTKTTFREIAGSVFDSQKLNSTMDAQMNFIIPKDNPQLITDDFHTLNELAFQIHYLSKMCLGNSSRAASLRADAENLIKLIQEEYKLD